MEMGNSIQVPSQLTNNVVSPLWPLFYGLQSRFYTELFPEAVLRMRGDIEDEASLLFSPCSWWSTAILTMAGSLYFYWYCIPHLLLRTLKKISIFPYWNMLIRNVASARLLETLSLELILEDKRRKMYVKYRFILEFKDKINGVKNN